MATIDPAAAGVSLGEIEMMRIVEPMDSVDLTGLRCPYLARRIRKAMSRASVGKCLEFVCDDPLASIDVAHLIATLGDDLVARSQAGTQLSFVVRRTDRSPSLRS